MKQSINQTVVITAMGFKKNLEVYPRSMEYQGKVYEFIDSGLRCIIRQGEQMAQVLTMSDGVANFKLRSDNKGNSWTLVSIG